MDYSHSYYTKNAGETKKLGETLGISLKEKGERGEALDSMFCLHGILGSGKTTFIQGLAKGLGIATRLLSPTFIIVRRYPLSFGTSFFYHIDLYRVGSKQSLASLGLSEIFTDPQSIVCIEWAERLEDLIPKKRVDITFSVGIEDQRTITFEEKL